MDGYIPQLHNALGGNRPDHQQQQHQPVRDQAALEGHLRMLQILKRIEDEHGPINIPNMISLLLAVQEYRQRQERMMNQTMVQKRHIDQVLEFMSQQQQQKQNQQHGTTAKPSIQNGSASAARMERVSAFTPVVQEFRPQAPRGEVVIQSSEQEQKEDQRYDEAHRTRNMDLLSLVTEKLSALQNEANSAKVHKTVGTPDFLSGPVKDPRSFKNMVEEKLAGSVLAGSYENRIDESLLGRDASGPPAFDVIRDRLIQQYGRPIERVEKKMTNSSYLIRFNVTASMASKLLPPIPTNIEELKKSNEFKSVFKHDIVLVDVFGRNHNVKYEGIVSSRQRHNRLTTGWCSAARSIGLDVGDTIIFERWTDDRRIIHFLVEKDTGSASDDSSSRKRPRS